MSHMDFGLEWTSLLFEHTTDFHLLLLKLFGALLATTSLLVLLSWRVYGKRICERFMQKPTSRAVQELKDSVSRLRLPKEHTPRI